MKMRVSAVAVLCMFLSAVAFAQKTQVDWDKSANFAGYRTYMWENSPNPAKGAWNQRILDAIDKQLQAKGLTKVDSNPDLWVVYSNSVRNETDVVGVGYVPGPSWGTSGPAAHHTYVTKLGTLVVDLADTKGKQLVWRGSVTGAITDNNDKNISNLDKAVAKLFQKYPPKQKK
jgi:hypothetical protein